MVEHAPHEKNLGWEYVYNENNIDPVLGDQFLSEAYYRADDDYQGRTTVPALIDTTTGKVVNNDYNWLTTYFEVNFRPWHKKGAPELYPVELREEIDKMNLWLFDNINNAVYRSSFSRSNEGHFDGVNTFYAAMDRLEKRLETNRFLFGDYVTDSDIRLYVTLARLDIRYTAQLGETKHPLYTYKNLWGYAKELWEIPAFKNNTFFADFAVPHFAFAGNTTVGYCMEKDKGRKTMKQNFAILAVTALLLCSLTACGGDQNNGAANGNVNGAENGTTSGMTGKTDSGSNVGGELKTDPATGTRYTGRENDSVVRYGNGYGNTSADKRAGTKNATANSTLHGSYNNPTGTPAGQTAASARGMSNELRYRLMLENAHVHDTDGFLLDGENAHYNTFR